MNKREPQQLLREYVTHRSEDAFAELVRQQGGLVYGSALRILRNPALAEDVCQKVFIALASHAPRLQNRPSLSGWLHKTTHNFAVMLVRSEERRRCREEKAGVAEDPHPSGNDPHSLSPVLDDALARLSDDDREILLLRYFEGQSGRELAATLNLSEDAIHKRASRALERLRATLAKTGLPLPAAAITAALSNHSATAALPTEATARIAAHASGHAVVPQPLLPLLGSLHTKPVLACGLALLCVSLGTAGFVAGRAGAARHYSMARWQPAVSGTEAPPPAVPPLPAQPSIAPDSPAPLLKPTVSQLMATAAAHFRSGDQDPDAWSKGTVALDQIDPAHWAEAIAELEKYKAEPAVFNAMAPPVLGIWAQAAPERAAEFALAHLSGNSRGLALERIFQGWGQTDPAAAWNFFVRQTESGDPPIPHASWMWMPRTIFAEWAAADLEGAFRQYAELDFADEQMALHGLVTAALEPELRPAILEKIQGLADEKKRERLAIKLVSNWARHEPAAAGAWAAAFPLANPGARIGIIGEVMEEWWRIDPHGATRWFLTSAPEQARAHLMPIFNAHRKGEL